MIGRDDPQWKFLKNVADIFISKRSLPPTVAEAERIRGGCMGQRTMFPPIFKVVSGGVYFGRGGASIEKGFLDSTAVWRRE